MTWFIEINSILGEEEAILSALNQSGYKLIVEGSEKTKKRFLSHPKYENFENARDIHKDGRHITKTLHDFAKLEKLILKIDLGRVQKRNSDGSVKGYIFGSASMTVGAVTSTATATVIPNPNISHEEREGLAQEAIKLHEEKRKLALANRLASSLENSKVLQVMELLSVEQPNGADLGNIIDLVRDACKGDLSAFASKKDIERFDRSINHQEVLGPKARHVTSNKQPPPKPMTLNDAMLFAHRIGKAWLASFEEHS